MEQMIVRHIELKDANRFVEQHHRHHGKAAGHRFSLGCYIGNELIGIAIVGRPVSRMLNQNDTVEVVRMCVACNRSDCCHSGIDCRVCEDYTGYPNACSKLYGACRRAAAALGYHQIISYILESESGASLVASGWEYCYTTKGDEWNRKNRPRAPARCPTPKKLYHSIINYR